MLDLDHFKSINDRNGHATGDDVLGLFAARRAREPAGNDLVGRLGGEEFAVILPEPGEVAAMIAERLRSAFQAAGVIVGEHALGATVSIGAATSYQPVNDISALLSRADAALYRAKHAGRNRVCADGERAPIPGGRPVPESGEAAGAALAKVPAKGK